jgi:hypothetical protein
LNVQGLRSGFRVSGLGFRVSGLGFRVLGFGFRVWGLGFRVLGFGFWVLGVKNIGFCVLDPLKSRVKGDLCCAMTKCLGPHPDFDNFTTYDLTTFTTSRTRCNPSRNWIFAL